MFSHCTEHENGLVNDVKSVGPRVDVISHQILMKTVPGPVV